MIGTVDNERVAIGNVKLLESMSIDLATLRERADELRRSGQTVMYIVIGERMAGLVGVADPIKESAAAAIRALQAEGMRVVMLMGDNRTTAEAVARAVGVDDVTGRCPAGSKGGRGQSASAEGAARRHGG